MVEDRVEVVLSLLVPSTCGCSVSTSGMLSAFYSTPIETQSFSTGLARAYTRILPFMSSIMLWYFFRIMFSSCIVQ